MKKKLLSIMLLIFSCNAFSYDTCSVYIEESHDDDNFGEYFKIKIKYKYENLNPKEKRNVIVFSNIESDPELGNVTIKRRDGRLLILKNGSIVGTTKGVMNFRFVSDKKDLSTIPAGTYQARADIMAVCASL